MTTKKEITKTQTLEKYEGNFVEKLEATRFNINAFKETARFPVTSQAKLEESKAVMQNIKLFKKGSDNLYNDFYKPIYDFAQSMIYKPIKELKDEIKKIEDYHKDQQLSWLKKKREEEAKKQAEIEKQFEKEEITMEQAGKKLERVEAKVEAVKGVTVKKVLKVVDFAKVPDKYKLINQPLLNADMKAGIIIPGTQIVEEESLSNRY